MRLFVLHNPSAGGADLELETLLQLLRDHGHEAVSGSPDDEEGEQELDTSFDLLVAAGGDGTVARLARTTVARQIPIAVLPLGTANNISNALHPDGPSITSLVSGWTTAVRQPFDLGVARGPWGARIFLESIGAGLIAETIAEVDHTDGASINDVDDPALRVAAARHVSAHILERLAPVALEVHVDGQRHAGEYVLVEVLNFGAAGPNLRFTPTSDYADGLFDVVLVTHEDRQHLLDFLQSDRAEPAKLTALRARRVTIHGEGCLLHLDDRLERSAERQRISVDVSVQHAALTFLVPG
jgi:diacylglycerol kinase (ATP)